MADAIFRELTGGDGHHEARLASLTSSPSTRPCARDPAPLDHVCHTM